MKKITGFIKKNKIASAVLFVAVILALGIMVAYSQTKEQMKQELAAKQQSSEMTSDTVQNEDAAIFEIAKLQSMEDDAPSCQGWTSCSNPTDGTCSGGKSLCWSSSSEKGLCCVPPASTTQPPDNNDCPGYPNGICPTEAPVSCDSLGGSCTDDASICDSRYINAAGCSAKCCVPLPDSNPAPTKSDAPSCQDWTVCENKNNNGSCSSGKSICYSNASQAELCCRPPAGTTPYVPAPTQGDNGDNTQPNPTSTPPTNNVCQQQVTCGACDQSCSEGSAHKCRTCQTANGTCSYREACGNNDTDPIYKSTCGKGDFTNETRQQRKETISGYTHVKCTGTSTCTGGPNADGLYWCVQELSPTTTPGQNCSINFKQNTSCDTKCGKYFQCSESDVKFQSCAESAACNLATPTPTTSPVPTPATGTDTGTLSPVTVTASQGPCGGHTKIYWTAATANTSNGYWLYRGSTADFKPSQATLIAGNISPNKTAQSPYYDWLSEPSKTYYYRVIASGTGGNTKWSNAAQVTASTQCGSGSTTPNNPSPTTSPSVTQSPAPTGDYMTKCNDATGRGANCACTANTQCSNGWCNGGKCHYAPVTTTCPTTNKPSACICETNAQCTSGWCNGGRCN